MESVDSEKRKYDAYAFYRRRFRNSKIFISNEDKEYVKNKLLTSSLDFSKNFEVRR